MIKLAAFYNGIMHVPRIFDTLVVVCCGKLAILRQAVCCSPDWSLYHPLPLGQLHVRIYL